MTSRALRTNFLKGRRWAGSSASGLIWVFHCSEKGRRSARSRCDVLRCSHSQTRRSHSSRPSPTNIRPVFDAIVESAARLCDGVFSTLHTFDGELMHLVAAHNWTPAAFEAARRVWPARPSQATVTGRAVFERTIIHVADGRTLDLEYQNQELLKAIGFRST